MRIAISFNRLRAQVIKSNRSKTLLFPLYFIEPVSVVLSLCFYNLRFVHPNFITVVGLFCYGLSCCFFVVGRYFYGSLCFYVALIMDFTDGKLARMKESPSKFGARLDNLVNTYGKVIVVLGILYSFYYLKGKLIVGIVLFSVHYGTHYFIKRILRMKPPGMKAFPVMDEMKSHERPGFFSLKRVIYPFSPYEENLLVFIIGPVAGCVTEMILISSMLYLVNSYAVHRMRKKQVVEVSS